MEHFLEALEAEFSTQRELEKLSVAREAKLAEFAQTTLADRLRVTAGDTTVTIRAGGLRVHGQVVRVGADWVCIEAERSDVFVRLDAIQSLHMEAPSVAAKPDTGVPTDMLASRMTLGFVLRDLARRHARVALASHEGHWRTARVLRAGVDHCDVEEESGTIDIVPFTAILAVRTDG